MTIPDLLQQQDARSWRVIQTMGWFNRKRGQRRDDMAELAAASAAAQVSLTTARSTRDREVRKLARERSEVVEPLMEIHAGNHFAELATRAFRRRNGGKR